ncbi:hypothetical protein [Streptomyces sp. ODS05-4]|uniref:hypothetical protein n=1 Tax=Streptomyces sp. ODS05-4 TaxID=2944939 RepID=UPI00210A5761|nr:hypothetical protein [Streptomyces sp. ODS05-4]
MSRPAPSARSIGEVLVSSRPFDDYATQFALSAHDLSGGPVLDCPGGAGDFGATVRSRGGRVVSVDPCYLCSPDELTVRVEAELDRVGSWTASQPDRFSLDGHGVWQQMPAWRSSAARFLADYAADRRDATGHYVRSSLPRLPFADGAFSLALSGFLLFTYPDHFDEEFHLRALTELLRVAADVRVHPLNDSSGSPYPHLDRLLARLRSQGVAGELLPVAGRSDRRDDLTLRLTRS